MAGRGVSPSITLGYVMVAGVFYLCDRYLRAPSEDVEPAGGPQPVAAE